MEKKLGLSALTALVLSSMLGAGVFSLPQNMAAVASPSALLIGWGITGVGILFLAFAMLLLTRIRPELDGGIFTYAREGFGELIGFCSAWGYWLCAVVANVSYLVIVFSALSFFTDTPELRLFGDGNTWQSIVGASVLLWIVHFLVLRGVQTAAGINLAATLAKLLPLGAFIALAAIAFRMETFRLDFSGLALAIKDTAISTFSNQLIDPQTLLSPPIRQTQIDGLPLKVYLYANSWLAENTQFALLLGVVCGLLAGLLSYYILTIKSDPRKELLLAIKNDQFYVVYQPVVRSETLRISGVEVLMRWRHPVAGEIPPDVFINLAETQQIIIPLTRHLLKLIAQDAPVLQTLLPAGSKLGINISPLHLHAGSFQQDLQHFAAAMPAGHFSVVLEITERAMIDKNRSLGNFDWLHEQGFEIAIDDFGTGHSALIYLERYNFDYLKIDRGFVQAIGTETVTSPVLDAVITLSRRLKLTTVAEGVETQEQAEWLRDHGVNYLQGYWLSRPLTLDALIAAHDEPAKYFTSR